MGDERNSKTNKRKDAPSQDHGIKHDSAACGDDETNSEEHDHGAFEFMYQPFNNVQDRDGKKVEVGRAEKRTRSPIS
jgi:hypothetical protein